MNKIVIDANVLLNSLIGEVDSGGELLRRCLAGAYKPVVNTRLFSEYEGVSRQAAILQTCPLAPEEIRQLLNAFYCVCEWVQVHYLWRPHLKNDNGNFLIALAVSSNATCIVTNNTTDLMYAALTFKHLQILRPAQLLAR